MAAKVILPEVHRTYLGDTDPAALNAAAEGLAQFLLYGLAPEKSAEGADKKVDGAGPAHSERTGIGA